MKFALKTLVAAAAFVAAGVASAATVAPGGSLGGDRIRAEWGIRSAAVYLAVRRLRWGYLTSGDDDPRKGANLALPEGVSLIISADKIDKRRAFWKFLEKHASVQVHDRIDMSRDNWEEQVEVLVRDKAKNVGLTFENDAMELFIRLAGEAAQLSPEPGQEKRSDDQIADTLRRIDARIVELAEGYAARLGAPRDRP